MVIRKVSVILAKVLLQYTYRVDRHSLKRDPKTNAFNSADLANLIQNATEASASAFKARGIPEVLRVVEVMGIEQARRWGTCTVSSSNSALKLRRGGG